MSPITTFFIILGVIIILMWIIHHMLSTNYNPDKLSELDIVFLNGIMSKVSALYIEKEKLMFVDLFSEIYMYNSKTFFRTLVRNIEELTDPYKEKLSDDAKIIIYQIANYHEES